MSSGGIGLPHREGCCIGRCKYLKGVMSTQGSAEEEINVKISFPNPTCFFLGQAKVQKVAPYSIRVRMNTCCLRSAASVHQSQTSSSSKEAHFQEQKMQEPKKFPKTPKNKR